MKKMNQFSTWTIGCALALVLLVVPACGEGGEALPRVHVIATGGTISGVGYGKTKAQGAEALLAAIPQLNKIATITAEDPMTIDSASMTPQIMLDLSQKVEEIFADDPGLAGIVITHGTDSMEETAFFFDLVLKAERPVIFTGAMRTRKQLGADGSRNLLNAVRIAASTAARGLGVLVTLNDEIHAAREIRKLHSSSVDAFESPGVGRLGYIDDGDIFLLQKSLRRAHIKTKTIEPKVDLVVATTGSDGHQVRSAVEAGARGLVIELFGRGNAPRSMTREVVKARRNGITVVFTSRTGEGGLHHPTFWRENQILSAEDLGGIKARLVLIAALATTQDHATLQSYFHDLSGKVGD